MSYTLIHISVTNATYHLLWSFDIGFGSVVNLNLRQHSQFKFLEIPNKKEELMFYWLRKNIM